MWEDSEPIVIGILFDIDTDLPDWVSRHAVHDFAKPQGCQRSFEKVEGEMNSRFPFVETGERVLATAQITQITWEQVLAGRSPLLFSPV